jgi:catechol 2,3-dioxygenase-like lactoylglutathione lyase family enzyme
MPGDHELEDPRPGPPFALDHVALWVGDRDKLAGFLEAHLGMVAVLRSETFTLMGAEPHAGKLTLFDAEGAREPGALQRVVLRVADLESALAKLPVDLAVERGADRVARFQAPDRLGLGLVEAPQGGTQYDIDHVVLQVSDAERTLRELELLGFERRGAALWVGDRHVVVEENGGAAVDRPLLNHIALLVGSAQEQKSRVELGPFEITDVREAENTFAVFVRGSDGIELEYVEHKADSAIF